MRKYLATGIVALAVGLFASASFAQAPNSIGVYFTDVDPSDADRCAAGLPGLAPFSAYLFAFEAGNISGWEASVDVSVGASLIIQSAETNPIDVVNLGTNVNWIVGLGGEFDASALLRLVSYSFVFLGNPMPEIQFCVGGTSPSSFDPPQPGYIQSGEVLPFDLAYPNVPNDLDIKYAAGCAVANPDFPGQCAVGVEPTTFGAVKSSF
jgi:hypothetical protein